MNENREITAESQHNFHFLAHYNSKTTGPIFTIFSQDVEQLVKLLMCLYARRRSFRFRTREQRVKTVNFDVCKNPPKL